MFLINQGPVRQRSAVAGFALLLSKLIFWSQARIYIGYCQLAALAPTAASACEPVQAERSAILDEWHVAVERKNLIHPQIIPLRKSEPFRPPSPDRPF